MKRVILFFALMLVCASAFSACGEIHEFRYFYIDIPEGWDVKENDSMINITADDESGSLMIKAEALNGESLDKLAFDFANELGAVQVNVDSEDDYIFEFNDDRQQAILTGDKDFYMLIATSGVYQAEQSDDVMIKILDSLEMK